MEKEDYELMLLNEREETKKRIARIRIFYIILVIITLLCGAGFSYYSLYKERITTTGSFHSITTYTNDGGFVRNWKGQDIRVVYSNSNGVYFKKGNNNVNINGGVTIIEQVPEDFELPKIKYESDDDIDSTESSSTDTVSTESTSTDKK